MGKTAQLHLRISSESLESLKKEASKQGLMLAEYCRQKILFSQELEIIKEQLKKLLEKNGIK